MPRQLGQIKQDTKRLKTQLPTLKYGEPKQGTVHHTCIQNYRRGGQTFEANPLAQPMVLLLPAAHLREELAPTLPNSGSRQGHLLPVFASSCSSTTPNKDLPEVLIWPLTSFY